MRCELRSRRFFGADSVPTSALVAVAATRWALAWLRFEALGKAEAGLALVAVGFGSHDRDPQGWLEMRRSMPSVMAQLPLPGSRDTRAVLPQGSGTSRLGATNGYVRSRMPSRVIAPTDTSMYLWALQVQLACTDSRSKLLRTTPPPRPVPRCSTYRPGLMPLRWCRGWTARHLM